MHLPNFPYGFDIVLIFLRKCMMSSSVSGALLGAVRNASQGSGGTRDVWVAGAWCQTSPRSMGYLYSQHCAAKWMGRGSANLASVRPDAVASSFLWIQLGTLEDEFT